MKIFQPTKKPQSSIQPLFAWIILASCFAVFFSREIAFIGALTGTILWLLSTTKQHLLLFIPFILTVGLAFTIPLPITGINTPIIALATTIMFWSLILTTTTLCLFYLLPKNQAQNHLPTID